MQLNVHPPLPLGDPSDAFPPEVQHMLYIGRVCLSSLVFLVYTYNLVRVLINVRMRFDCLAYFTVTAFFLSTLTNMVYSITMLADN
jgi:hypothetical protein